MRFAVGFCILAFSPAIFAGEPRIHRDLAYFEPKEQRRTLDVYTTTESKNRPVVFWIHGGGWQRGDKSDVAAKPWAFLDKGFVFVSTNYRFVPNVTMKQIAGDLAKAIRWTHDHAGPGGWPGSRSSARVCRILVRAHGSVSPGSSCPGGDSHSSPGRSRFRFSADSRVYRSARGRRPLLLFSLALRARLVGPHDHHRLRTMPAGIFAAVNQWRLGPFRRCHNGPFARRH